MRVAAAIAHDDPRVGVSGGLPQFHHVGRKERPLRGGCLASTGNHQGIEILAITLTGPHLEAGGQRSLRRFELVKPHHLEATVV